MSPALRTVVDVLRDNAARVDRAVTFRRLDGEERVVGYPDLWRRACERAHAFAALGLEKDDRMALVLPEPDEFVVSFLGALVAGVVAVPVYPPATLAKMESYGETLGHVLAMSGAKALVVGDSVHTLLRGHVASQNGHAPTLLSEGELAERAAAVAGADTPPRPVGPDDLAFLQFTSGSTSHPKGVMVSHRNLAVNSRLIMFDGLRSTEADRGVTWLPLYHDMGLVGFVVAPLYACVPVLFLPTAGFIRRPSLWLDTVHRYRGTITFAPNFAFSLATRAVTDRQSAEWDLSCLRALGCGAEPIQAEVLRAFVERFAPNGLRPESLLPCYGMAEATLALTFHDVTAPIRTEVASLASIEAGRAERSGAGLELVSCGKPFDGHDLVIVDRSGKHLGEREVGEIWVRGPSIAGGYFADARATEETFGGGWLRTGDLGYLAGGELFVCGRVKDLIILNGKNYHPQDIERIVSTVEGVRADQCIAFSRLDPDGAERAVVVAEGRKGGPVTVHNAVIQAVKSELGLTISEVHLIRRGTLPRTSSGKVRRAETKRRLEAGQLERLEDGDSDEREVQANGI